MSDMRLLFIANDVYFKLEIYVGQNFEVLKQFEHHHEANQWKHKISVNKGL